MQLSLTVVKAFITVYNILEIVKSSLISEKIFQDYMHNPATPQIFETC